VNPRALSSLGFRALAGLLIGLVQLYRAVFSPLKRVPSCRFQPTCSEYALLALQRHGPFTGSWLAVRRLLKCHPLHPGGYDPVPGGGHHLAPEESA